MCQDYFELVSLFLCLYPTTSCPLLVLQLLLCKADTKVMAKCRSAYKACKKQWVSLNEVIIVVMGDVS